MKATVRSPTDTWKNDPKRRIVGVTDGAKTAKYTRVPSAPIVVGGRLARSRTVNIQRMGIRRNIVIWKNMKIKFRIQNLNFKQVFSHIETHFLKLVLRVSQQYIH
jgi:hypothetical protein